jgi:hypothetical protein
MEERTDSDSVVGRVFPRITRSGREEAGEDASMLSSSMALDIPPCISWVYNAFEDEIYVFH